MQRIAPWIVGVIIVFLGVFLIGFAVEHQSLFGAGTTIAVVAQQEPGNGLQVLLHGNNAFGTRLLQQVHSETSDKNVVVAPLSITILLGAIQTSSDRDEARKEFDHVFAWGTDPHLPIPARMILAAMEKPKPVSAGAARPGIMWDGLMYEPESLWMENRLLYRSPKTGPPLLDPRFMESASRNFGLQLVNTGEKNPSESALRGSREDVGRVPTISPLAQVWLSSGFHMRQTWEELFGESKPEPGEFRLESGQTRTVLKVESNLRKFPHLKTDQLESVALPCGRVQMIVVLPAPKMTIQKLEELLVSHPDALSGMSTSRYGSVTFPPFEIKTTAHLENALMAMGITDIFQHLDGVTSGMIPAAESRVTDLAQTIDFGADKHGIHADAETLIGAVPLGILSVEDPFQMSLDRPFVFFVRETTTNALLFAGAFMDPGEATR
jgi:serpin B